jgi:peptidoglycan/xylan/chitin deacetylase (PgdA/CDA1 family)
LATIVVAAVGFVNGYWTVLVPMAIGLLFLILKIYGSFFISSNFYLNALCRGDRSSNSIAITFDDGPTLGGTDRVLQILKEKNVKATFFCIGRNVANVEWLLRQMDADGHLIGNHTFNHAKWFDLQSPEKMREELVKTDDAISLAINKKPKLFRPPYGVTNPNLARAVGDGYQTIGWSVRSFDTASKDKNRIWKRVTKKLKGGDIVLFHDRCEITIELLPKFIDHVSNAGLKIVPLDQLLRLKPYA